MSPAGPLEPHLASPNRVLIGGQCYRTAPHAPNGALLRVRFCFAIWGRRLQQALFPKLRLGALPCPVAGPIKKLDPFYHIQIMALRATGG